MIHILFTSEFELILGIDVVRKFSLRIPDRSGSFIRECPIEKQKWRWASKDEQMIRKHDWPAYIEIAFIDSWNIGQVLFHKTWLLLCLPLHCLYPKAIITCWIYPKDLTIGLSTLIHKIYNLYSWKQDDNMTFSLSLHILVHTLMNTHINTCTDST